jgi:hypothetical protein
MQLGVIEVHARLLGRHHAAGIQGLRGGRGRAALRDRYAGAGTEAERHAEAEQIRAKSHERLRRMETSQDAAFPVGVTTPEVTLP